MYLRGALRELKQGDMPVSEYLSKATFIRDELIAIDKAPDYDNFLFQIMSELRPEFENMKTSILSRKEHVPMAEVKSLLIAHEYMLKSSTVAPLLPTPDPPHLLGTLRRQSFCSGSPWQRLLGSFPASE